MKYVNFKHPRNGTQYTNAYCELNIIEINKSQLKAHVRFDIWASKADYDAGAQIVHDSSFDVVGDEFVTAMTEETLKQKSVSQICYEHAATKLKVDSRDPIKESPLLFATATDSPA